jgi:hypothetical protein
MLYGSEFGICVVCPRIADMPAPKVPSVRLKCAHCCGRIWVPKGSPTGLPKLCPACTSKRYKSKRNPWCHLQRDIVIMSRSFTLSRIARISQLG